MNQEHLTLSADAPGLAASTLDCTGPEGSKQSVTSKEKIIQSLSYSIKCDKGTWILPRSGLTSKPSTDDLGVESWICSLRAFRANRTLLPVNVLANLMKEIFGLTWRESQGRWNPDTSSWKTSQACLLATDHTDLRSLGNCKQWVISFSNLIYLLRQSEPITGETESSSLGPRWPTPTSSDSYIGKLESLQIKKGTMHSVNLPKAVRIFPTPLARDWKGGSKKRDRLPDAVGAINKVTGHLNPTWVEWLMGLPLGWTELKR